MEPSKYQQAIFEIIPSLLEKHEHLMVEAVAGSGKTWTIERVWELCTTSISAKFLAFNKSIATELQNRGLDASTFHSLGMAVCRENVRGRVRVDKDKVKKILQWEIYDFKNASKEKKSEFYKVLNPICKIIGLCKGHGVFNSAMVEQLVERHGIEIPDVPDFNEVLNTTWSMSLARDWVIDFDDMLFLPIKNNWPFPRYDLVCVDETQDLNPVQAEIVRQIAKTAIFVGDSGQAIYGFRGADPESMFKIANDFQCHLLPLSICYRCPKRVVEEAQRWVPHIEASPTAEEGIVKTINEDEYDGEISEGDYVLCRTTAPLVSRCLQLISQGRYAKVLGREIGTGLVALVQDLHHGTSEDFLASLSEYRAVETEKLKRRDRDTTALDDKCDCLSALAAAVKTTDKLIAKINTIFSDSEARDGITFSTIHKAKGLEGDRIFILHPELLPHPKATLPWQIKQEDNLAYVAVTRAKKELYWVKCKGT